MQMTATVRRMGGALPVERVAGDMGLWTPDQVRGRLVEALDVLRRLRRAPHSSPADYAAAWPLIVRDYFESYGAEAPRMPLAMPGPSAIARLDETLPWFYLVADRRHQKAMLIRAIPMSWRKVGLILGCDHKTAQAWEAAAIDSVVVALNHNMRLDSSVKSP